jgi:hypothetical protein
MEIFIKGNYVPQKDEILLGVMRQAVEISYRALCSAKGELNWSKFDMLKIETLLLTIQVFQEIEQLTQQLEKTCSPLEAIIREPTSYAGELFAATKQTIMGD